MSFLLWMSAILCSMGALALAGVVDESKPGQAIRFWALAWVCSSVFMLLKGSRRRALWVSAVGIGAMVAWLAVTIPWLFELGARSGPSSHASSLLHPVLVGLGLEVDRVGSALVAQTGQLVVANLDWAKLGVWPGLWIAVAGSVLLTTFHKQRPLRSALVLWTTVGAYLVLRTAVLLGLGFHHPDPEHLSGNSPFVTSLFLEPSWQAITFLPLGFLLGSLLPWRSEEVRLRPLAAGAPRTVLCVAGIALVVGSAWSVWANLRPSGPSRGGRIAIDEFHSHHFWSAEAPLDTQTFGRDTVYSSTGLVRFLEQYYQVDVNRQEPWSDEVLADVDVLVLKTASVGFASEEVDAIERFVRRGGGLFLIGDHTDLLGMTTHLNSVAERFGAAFVKDACNRLHDGQAARWAPLPFATHPTTAGVGEFEFMTGCTVELPTDGEPVMVLRNAFAEPLDYSQPNFFGDVAPDMDDQLGLATIAGVLQADEGRVALFGDSTVLSSFCLTWPGHSEYLLRTVAWLNRRSGGGPALRVAAGAIALLGLALAAYFARRGPAASLALGLPTGLVLGGLLGVQGVQAWHGHTDALPQPRDPLTNVLFVNPGCDLGLRSPLLESDLPPERCFDTLVTWTLKAGLLPRVGSIESLGESQGVVLVHPKTAWWMEHLPRLERYVSGGGSLLVLSDDPEIGAACAAAFGISPDSGDAASERWRVSPHGAGRFALVADPERLSRSGLGNQTEAYPEEDPNHETARRLFRLLHAWV